MVTLFLSERGWLWVSCALVEILETICILTNDYYLIEYFVLYKNTLNTGGARGVIVIVVGNEHGDMSSNPGRD